VSFFGFGVTDLLPPPLLPPLGVALPPREFFDGVDATPALGTGSTVTTRMTSLRMAASQSQEHHTASENAAAVTEFENQASGANSRASSSLMSSSDALTNSSDPDAIGALLDEAERDFMASRMATNADLNPIADLSINSSGETPQMQQLIKELTNTINSRSIPQCAKAARLNEFLEDTLGKEWLLARQVWVLIKRFTLGAINRTSFGTYRVEIFIQLFSRILDVHNIEIILRELTAAEIACVQCRIGMLKLFNPMKPDGAVELHLHRYEERRVSYSTHKFLVFLNA